MAPRTAREAAQLLAQQGKHSHLHAEHESVCISAMCTPIPSILGTSLVGLKDTRPAGFRTAQSLASSTTPTL
ncbi:hypothetical protein ABTY96_46550 [Streptomyces sp. NPDC096057]|uniref:hypothetical protein n=1 Tax=Streptomyces sp. NPDC096057 TaxID=3155543 RepID=UPI00331CE1E0